MSCDAKVRARSAVLLIERRSAVSIFGFHWFPVIALTSSSRATLALMDHTGKISDHSGAVVSTTLSSFASSPLVMALTSTRMYPRRSGQDAPVL